MGLFGKKKTIESGPRPVEEVKEEDPKIGNLTEDSTTESAEVLKIEWGEEMEKMVCFKATKEIYKLNQNLGAGEQPWRLPSSKELEAKFGSSIGYWSRESYPGDEVGAMIKDGLTEKLVPVRDIV